MALAPPWFLQAKDASQVAPELSALVVYCQAVPFPGLAHALRHPQPWQMSSFSERKARKLIKEAGEHGGTGMGAEWLHAPGFAGMKDGAETHGLCHQGGFMGGGWERGGLGWAALVWWDWVLVAGSGARDKKSRVWGQSLGCGIWVQGQVWGLRLRSGSRSRD